MAKEEAKKAAAKKPAAEGKAEPRQDDDDDGGDLGDRALDRLENPLKRRLPRHARAGGDGGMGRCDEGRCGESELSDVPAHGPVLPDQTTCRAGATAGLSR